MIRWRRSQCMRRRNPRQARSRSDLQSARSDRTRATTTTAIIPKRSRCSRRRCAIFRKRCRSQTRSNLRRSRSRLSNHQRISDRARLRSARAGPFRQTGEWRGLAEAYFGIASPIFRKGTTNRVSKIRTGAQANRRSSRQLLARQNLRKHGRRLLVPQTTAGRHSIISKRRSTTTSAPITRPTRPMATTISESI